MTSTFRRTSSAARLGESLDLPACEPILDDNGLTLDVPGIAQASSKGLDVCRGSGRSTEQKPDVGDPHLLYLGVGQESGERQNDGNEKQHQHSKAFLICPRGIGRDGSAVLRGGLALRCLWTGGR